MIVWGALQVETGLSLVAFIVAAILLAYRARLTQRAKIIKTAPEQERLEAIAATAEFFRVDVSRLTRAQQTDVVLTQIRARARRHLLWAVVSSVVFVLLAAIAMVSIWPSTGPVNIGLNEADQRAWVKVETVEPFTSPNQLMDGLRFFDAMSPAHLPLHLVLKNVGRSPAFGIVVGVWPVFEPPSNLSKEQQERCVGLGKSYPEEAVPAMNSDIIRVLFPGDSQPYDGRALGIMPADIEKYASGDPKSFSFWFYGCVYYRLSTKEPRQTGFAYWVTRIVDAPIPGGKAQSGFIAWQSVPADRLLFTPMPLASPVTN